MEKEEKAEEPTNNLQAFIRRKNLNQGEFAKLIGVAAPTVSQYISGESGISTKRMRLMIDMGITPEELFGETAGKKIRELVISDYLSSGLEGKKLNFTEEEAAEMVRVGIFKLLGRGGNV